MAATNQVDGTATLIDGTVLHQIDPTAQVVRNFEYLGYMRYDGKVLEAQESVQDAVYYCDFPGERMFKKVSIEVNGNPLDEYYTFSYVFARQFELKADKKDGTTEMSVRSFPSSLSQLMLGMVLDLAVLCSKDLRLPQQFSQHCKSGRNLCSGSIRTPLTHFPRPLFHSVKDISESNSPKHLPLYSDHRSFITYLRPQTNLFPMQSLPSNPMADTIYREV